jgi:hypothetical protein
VSLRLKGDRTLNYSVESEVAPVLLPLLWGVSNELDVYTLVRYASHDTSMRSSPAQSGNQNPTLVPYGSLGHGAATVGSLWEQSWSENQEFSARHSLI